MSAYRRRDDAVAIANRIVVFVPRTIDDAVWERVGPWVRSTVTAADPAIDSQATTLLKALAHLAAWAYEHAIPIETEAVLQPEVLERYRLTGMRRLSARSRSAEMSRLRRVARVVTQRAPWPAPNERGPRGPLSPPYSDDEVRQFWRDAELQHSLFRRHAMNALLALTLGVGVRPRELFLPTADHIEMVDDVMAVRIPGNHARVVPVRRECVDQIRIAAVTAPRGPLVGSGRTGRDRAAALIATFELAPAAPPLLMQRLRSTWLRDVLAGRVHIADVLAIADLTTSRAISDLAPYLRASCPGSDPWKSLAGEPEV